MDISDFIGGQNDLDSFISCNFNKVEYAGFKNPMNPFKVNSINSTDSLKFCSMSIQQCWLQKIDTMFSFFILIKNTADVEKNISAKYGKCDGSGFVNIQGTPLGNGVFIWRKGSLRIEVMTYFNLLRVPEYEMCDLIICGNMNDIRLSDVLGQ